VTKYDAFGRKIDEDPLAALRGDAESSMPHEKPVQPEPQPHVHTGHDAAPRDDEPFGATARTIDLRPHRNLLFGGCLTWMVGLLIAGAVLGGVIYSVVDDVDDAVDSTREAIESARPQDPGAPADAGRDDGGGRGEDAGPALGLERGSLLTRASLAPALARLRDGGHGRIRLLRAAPDRLNVQTVTRAGALRNVNVGPDGRPEMVNESPGVGRTMATVAYADIDPAAPFRLTRSAAGRLRLPTTRVDYLVLLAMPGTPARWLVYFKDGRGAFEGDRRGRVVRRIS
jgi:hypothetical protein